MLAAKKPGYILKERKFEVAIRKPIACIDGKDSKKYNSGDEEDDYKCYKECDMPTSKSKPCPEKCE